MVLIDSLIETNITVDLKPANRWDVIKDLVSLLVKSGQIPASISEQVSKSLVEREKSMSTGIGKGVAIPHCAIEAIDDAKVALAVLDKGINFEAIDDAPVQLVVLLLSPKLKMQQHVKNLASIAKFLSTDDNKHSLLGLKSAAEIKKFINEHGIHVK